jgi:hypothetical protein
MFEYFKAKTEKYDSNIGLTVVLECGYYVIEIGKDFTVLEPEVFLAFLGYATDCFYPVYPLGSVVKLKKMSFIERPEFKGANLYLVITERFLTHMDEKLYAPYAGTAYPFSVAPERKILFGPQLVEELVYQGFSDELERSYVVLMKKELLLERGLHSFGFASKEEMVSHKRAMAERGE